MNDTDQKNLINTLNLEYGATYRYALQTTRFNHPRAVALIEGVRRNEADHIALVMKRLEAEAGPAPEGFKSLFLHLKLNLVFEYEAVKFYGQYYRETEDPVVRETFRELMKAEGGHVRVFEALIQELEEGRFPKVFLCPLCGWEIDFSTDASTGTINRCEKCGARYELTIVEGDFTLKAV
jgi:rubrerythrin